METAREREMLRISQITGGKHMDNKLYKVIAVDDEIWALRGLCNIVDWEELGFSIIGSYTNSVEAIKAVEEQKPDVVFTDVRMPGIDGIELIDAIHNLGCTARVIIVSAYRDFEVAKQAIGKDVSEYLMKPLDKKEILEFLGRLKLQLDKENSEYDFNIMHYDLSQKSTLSESNITRYLEQLDVTGSCRLAVSDKEVAARAGMTEVYIKGYKHAYLFSDVSPVSVFDELFHSVTGNRYGISRVYPSFSDLSAMLDDAAESYGGCFVYSDNPKISEIQYYLSKHYAEKTSLPEIAEHFYVSESYLYELFRKNSDTSVVGFVKNIRLSKACAMLTAGGRTISEIADMVGYPDVGYFGKLFKTKYGCTPEQYATAHINSQTKGY